MGNGNAHEVSDRLSRALLLETGMDADGAGGFFGDPIGSARTLTSRKTDVRHPRLANTPLEGHQRQSHARTGNRSLSCIAMLRSRALVDCNISPRR